MTKVNSTNFLFKILHKDKKTKARVGKIKTVHGEVNTPAFVAVGTQATVKSLLPEDLNAIGVQIIFGNTYHLHLRPGEKIIEKFGGLNKFMGYKGVTMTDSGGFQVFSLARGNQRSPLSHVANDFLKDQQKLVNITEEGVEFRSHLDGSKHFFTPEKSIDIQKKIGADIMLSFDDCPPFPVTYDGAKVAMKRTHRWAERSLREFSHYEASARSHKGSISLAPTGGQALYGIVQGSIFEDLRKESAEFIGNMDFDGIAIGGVAVGEGKKEMKDDVTWVVPNLPEEKIRHLLGVGDVDDIFEIIEQGIEDRKSVV